MVKHATVCTLICLVVSHNWSLRQFDVICAFLHGTLSGDVYKAQPPCFSDKNFSSYIYRFRKSIYWLKQTPRTWYRALHASLRSVGFRSTQSDASLFVYSNDGIVAYLLVYVDDLILTGYTPTFLQIVGLKLASSFSLKVAHSSTELEYRVIAAAASKFHWIRS